MKRYIYILLALFAPLSGCKKFLNTEPTDFLSPVTYYENEEQLKFAIAGVYDILGQNAVYGTRLISRMNMEADEGYYVTATVTTGTQANDYTAADPDIENLWAMLYNGINRANVVLENVDKNTSISQAFRDQVRGEALFLRGYYYFLLVNYWGEVPLILESTKGVSSVQLPRSEVKAVYNQVLQDMETAETLVPSITQLGFAGRVSKSAVRGILARVNLYMAGYPLRDASRYEEVKKWAKMVIEDPEANHKLNPDFTQVFINLAQDKYDIQESIWEVEFWGNSGTYRETGQVGAWIGVSSTNAEIGTAYGFIQATAKLFQSYENTDLRRDWSIAPYYYTSTTNRIFHTSTTVASLYSRDCGKYRREYELVTPKSNQSTPINWPLLRLSDIMLMYAEADNKSGAGPAPALGSDAIKYVNLVRARANASLFTSANLITDPAEFHDFIIEERSRELCYEGMRRSDLIRWGIYEFTMNDMKNRMASDVPTANRSAFVNASAKHKLFPIPTKDLILNKSLTQNEGWN